tara:strand:- start:340 stop:1206 length:867 start_codon:yes stop_codon:yes gene_type:complete
MKNSIRDSFTQASLNLSNWWIIWLEIVVISIAIATYFDSVYIFMISLFILLTLFYNPAAAPYASTIFALFWALFPSMILSIFLGLNFIETIPELLSSSASKVLAITIFSIAFYFHISAASFINDVFEPIVKIFRFNLPLYIKNERFKVNIDGSDFKKKEVNRYVDNILFHLMPFYKKETIVNIEEVDTIDSNEPQHKDALGECSFDYRNTINIKIAKKCNGSKVSLEQKMLALAHELIHCKQFLKGELYGSNWHGRNYESVEYEKRPWEIEANYFQDKMYKKYYFNNR